MPETMSTDPPPELAPAVLRGFGLDDSDTGSRVVNDGPNGVTWRVDTRGSSYAVHRARVDDGAGDDVARHLVALVADGVAVPVPHAAIDGGWTVMVDGLAHRASSWVTGDPVAPDDLDAARRTGALLAQAHLVPGEVCPRPDLPPLVDVADAPRRGDWSLRAGLTRLGQPEPEVVAVLADLLRRVGLHLGTLQREIARHLAIVHLDVRPENVIRDRDGQVVLLDWDLAHADHRATDVAVAGRGWPQGATALLAGYESVTALTDAEHEALPLLAAARGLDHLGSRIVAWADDRATHSRVALVEEIERELVDLRARLEPYPDERWSRRGSGPDGGRG